MAIHSDSTSAIARASRSGAGPGQELARTIEKVVKHLRRSNRSVDTLWVKGNAGIPGNERADFLAGKAAEKGWSQVTSLAHLKLRISGRFRTANESWHHDPTHHGALEILPPPPRSHAWIEKGTRWPARQHRFAPVIGDRRGT